MKGKAAYRLLLAALCVALAAWLCVSAIAIYAEGSALRAEQPLAAIYTPQSAVARLAPAGALVVAIVALTVVGRRAGMEERSPDRGRVAVRPQPRPAPGWARAVAIAVAVLLIVLGALNGGARDVLAKAANICTECIGLG